MSLEGGREGREGRGRGRGGEGRGGGRGGESPQSFWRFFFFNISVARY